LALKVRSNFAVPGYRLAVGDRRIVGACALQECVAADLGGVGASKPSSERNIASL